MEPLQKDPYAGDAHSLKVFLSNLGDCSMVYGWDDILHVPVNSLLPNQGLRDMLTHYGQITLQQIVAHANTYAAGQTRTAQNSVMLYHCLANSITQEVKAKTMLYSNEYFIGDHPSGVAFLKVIIREAQIDTRATVLHIRSKLSSLDTYISTIAFDIVKFNAYVKDLVDSLAARGETTQDLLANLFKAYKAVKDCNFVAYIKKKEDQYEEGEDIEVDMLMLQASNKYKTMVQVGTWNAPSPEEEKILALQAQVQKLKSQKEQKEPKKQNKDSKGGKKEGKKNKGRNCEKPKWMLQPPPDADKSKPKKVDGKEYWWCSRHKSWGAHKESACEGKGLDRPKPNDGTDTPSPPAQTTQGALKLVKALSAVINDSE